MELLDKLLVAGFSALAVIVGALISMFISKKGIKTDTISKNRIEWIKEVRNLVKDFIKEYSRKDRKDNSELVLIRNYISLYLRDGVTSYKLLSDSLNNCIASNTYDEKLCNELILSARNVFEEVFIRAKREAGISQKEDLRFTDWFEGNNNDEP